MLRTYRWQQAERGQSLVEMSIGLIILTLIVMGILDLGRVYFLNLALEDAAGEAALYLSLNPYCPDASSGDDCSDPKNAKYRALHSGGANVDWSTAGFTYEYRNPGDGTWSQTIPNEVQSGMLVRVTIETEFQVLTPVISAITRGQPITLSVFAVGTVV